MISDLCELVSSAAQMCVCVNSSAPGGRPVTALHPPLPLSLMPDIDQLIDPGPVRCGTLAKTQPVTFYVDTQQLDAFSLLLPAES